LEADQTKKPKIGISACLMGQKVRHDGGHCSFPFLQEWSDAFLWRPVCPEIGMGLGTPRNPVRLVQGDMGLRMLESKSGRDVTELMHQFATNFGESWASLDLDGFVLKKKSPSCGLERVPLYSETGGKLGQTRGLFAQALLAIAPHLPVEEEGRLLDVNLRERFIERVYAYRRWKCFRRRATAKRELIAFHSCHKYQYLAHSRVYYSRMGHLVARSGDVPWDVLLDAYEQHFLACFAQPHTVKRHADVLFHLIGFFKKALPERDRHELIDLAEQFRLRKVPLSVPLTLLNHHAQKHGSDWMKTQTYLAPYPSDFNMRHHFFHERNP